MNLSYTQVYEIYLSRKIRIVISDYFYLEKFKFYVCQESENG